MDRRQFLGRVTVLLSAGIGFLVGLPIIGYLLAPLVARAEEAYVAVGKLTDFSVGRTTLVKFEDPSPLAWAGQTAATALWVRRIAVEGAGAFQVFNVNCSHLGCPVDWKPDARLFLCPCHGGVYYEDGRVAAGPPPRALFERAWRIEGGSLLVRAERLPTPGRPGA